MSKFKKILKSPIFKIAAPLALGAFGGPLTAALGSGLGIGSTGGAALLGAGTGLLGGGGLKGALLGGLGGAVGANLGSLPGTPLSGGLQGPTQGSGILGTIGNNAIGRGLSGALSGGATSSYGGSNPLTSILSAGLGTNANDDIEKQMLKAQQKNAALFSPFLDAKFTPGDLTQDPGYQFRLDQGNQNLGRTQSARGNYFSGQALKEAQDYGQGLADSTYNDAYQRYLQQQSQNLGAAGAMAGVNTGIGNIEANTTRDNNNLWSQGISSVFGSPGLSNTGALMGGSNALGNDFQVIGGQLYRKGVTGQLELVQ